MFFNLFAGICLSYSAVPAGAFAYMVNNFIPLRTHTITFFRNCFALLSPDVECVGAVCYGPSSHSCFFQVKAGVEIPAFAGTR